MHESGRPVVPDYAANPLHTETLWRWLEIQPEVTSIRVVLVLDHAPRGGPWQVEIVTETQAFTGQGDTQGDALCRAVLGLASGDHRPYEREKKDTCYE